MNSQFARLCLAAVVAIACTTSTTLAQDAPGPLALLLSWHEPTENTDGTPISDLQGYYIYSGLSPDTMIPVYYVSAPDPRIVFFCEGTRTHYFAVSAVNVEGLESVATAPVSAVPQPLAVSILGWRRARLP